MPERDNNSSPLVTILMPTFNRRNYLPFALKSAVAQNYRNTEIIVVNDGGQDISDIVNSFNDERIIFIDRAQNRGKPYSLNEALTRARGKYVCYLDDDDILYPTHVEKLVGALESQTDCQAAYSDLYKVHCRLGPDGNRLALSKIVEISRDFDRYFLMYFNHVLHVSLMHRRDLLEKTGPYNENLQVLIDWDMTRRLAFFTDFIHVHDVTGEFYGPVGECDRISVQQRKDPSKYLRNIMTIRMARPSKPWPKMKDLSIIYAPDAFDKTAQELLTKLWVMTFHVFKLILPVPIDQTQNVSITMPNLTRLSIAPGLTKQQRIDIALGSCEGDYIAVIPDNYTIGHAWVEDPLYALMACTEPNQAILLDKMQQSAFGGVFRAHELTAARNAFAHLSLEQSLEAAGIVVRKPKLEELPFKLDDLLERAKSYHADGDYQSAAKVFLHTSATCSNSLWMDQQAALCYFKASRYSQALDLTTAINRKRPTVDSLILESRICHKINDISKAASALEQAKAILQGTCLHGN